MTREEQKVWLCTEKMTRGIALDGTDSRSDDHGIHYQLMKLTALDEDVLILSTDSKDIVSLPIGRAFPAHRIVQMVHMFLFSMSGSDSVQCCGRR
jgi:hypothetical protein